MLASPELEDDLPIEGEVLTERDLADESDIMELSTPEGVDQGWLLGELFKDLHRGEHAKAVLAEAEMQRVIEFNRSVDHQFIDGLGQTVARIPLSVAMHWIARYGYEFWQQRDSIDFLAKRNPGMLIKSRGKTSVVVPGQVTSATSALGAAKADIGDCAGAASAAPVAGLRVRGRRGRWAA